MKFNVLYDGEVRLVGQRRVITNILLDPAYSKKDDSCLNLSEREWDLVKVLCDLLGVFEDVTANMYIEKHVTVSEILPIVCGQTFARESPRTCVFRGRASWDFLRFAVTRSVVAW